jgi:hypothetical protein
MLCREITYVIVCSIGKNCVDKNAEIFSVEKKAVSVTITVLWGVKQVSWEQEYCGEIYRFGMIPDFDRSPSELSPADAATCVA